MTLILIYRVAYFFNYDTVVYRICDTNIIERTQIHEISIVFMPYVTCVCVCVCEALFPLISKEI